MDIEKLLEQGKRLRIKPRGYSMYPLIVPGRDEVFVERVSPESLRRGDVVLYRRRDENILVLHRILWITREICGRHGRSHNHMREYKR